MPDHLDPFARPEDAFTPLPLSPWIDLATLALLSEAGELVVAGLEEADHPTALSKEILRRLAALVGTRPHHYWNDLLHYGATLRLFKLTAGRWRLESRESEILGATRRECFPALCAAWIKAPPPIPELAELTDDPCRQIGFRMDVLRLMADLRSGHWYPYKSLGVVLHFAARKHRLELSPELTERLASIFAERIFLVLGMATINPEGSHFQPRSDAHAPMEPETTCPHPEAVSRAEAFRKVVSKGFEQDTSWRRVATGLFRCSEVRRTLKATSDHLWAIDTDGHHLQTDPRLPFKDCLMLASLAQLVPSDSVRGAFKVPGSYVFKLDTDQLAQRIRDGLPLDQISAFLRERCDDTCFERLQTMLHQTESALP